MAGINRKVFNLVRTRNRFRNWFAEGLGLGDEVVGQFLQQQVDDLGGVPRVDDPLPFPDLIPDLLGRQVPEGAGLVLAQDLVLLFDGLLVVVADVNGAVRRNDVAWNVTTGAMTAAITQALSVLYWLGSKFNGRR